MANGGWFDNLRRVLGWKSSAPVAPAFPTLVRRGRIFTGRAPSSFGGSAVPSSFSGDAPSSFAGDQVSSSFSGRSPSTFTDIGGSND